jgi:DNA-binding CsgD family transcriptional regulator/PAS domain-containing protein
MTQASDNGTEKHRLDARLVELIYAGLSDPAHWQTFLDEFRACMRAGFVVLTIAYPSDSFYSIVLTSGLTEQQFHEFASWTPQDPWMERIYWDKLVLGEFRASHWICPDEILETTEPYQKFYGPNDWHYGGGIILGASNRQKAVLTHIRSKTLGPLSDDEVEFHRLLSPHLVRAVALHDERLRLRAERWASRALLDAAGNALLLLSEKGEIRLANAAAQALLERNQLLSSDKGHVRIGNAELHGRLLDAIGRVGAPRSNGANESLVLADDRTTLWATVSRLRQPGDSPLATQAPAVALSLVDPAHRPRLVPEPLQQLYGLTPAEAHVALLLADGLTADDVALRTGVVLDTVRTHIKRILAKTQLNRQPELVSLVLRVARPPLMTSNGEHS